MELGRDSMPKNVSFCGRPLGSKKIQSPLDIMTLYMELTITPSHEEKNFEKTVD